jgi:hypothetical protein
MNRFISRLRGLYRVSLGDMAFLLDEEQKSVMKFTFFSRREAASASDAPKVGKPSMSAPLLNWRT